MIVSMVKRCHETATHPISFDEIWNITRSGSHGLKEKITQIRNRYEAEKDITGSAEKAKKAISELKMELPGFLPSGTFKERQSAALVEHSGLLCADLDALGDRLPFVRESLKTLSFVRAIALSPSGDGLKVFFNVINDPSRHEDSFRSIRDNLRGMGVEIDDKCKDPARICFFTYDPDLYVRDEAGEIIPPADPLPRGRTAVVPQSADLNGRELIASRLLGELRPDPAKGGYFCRCPGESFHTNSTREKHTKVYLDGSPTLDCQHSSCASSVEAFNRVLRSEIGKAEYVPGTLKQANRNGEVAASEKPDEEDWFPKLQSSIVLATSADLGALTLKPRIPLLGDWLCESDYGIIFGPRGVAKTWFSLMIANAVATGTALGAWKADNPSRVLFIDGEMPADMIRDRLLGFGGSENITLLNHEILFDRTQTVINVTQSKQQEAFLKLCIEQNFKLLILDNLSVCAFGIKENDSYEWEQLHRWLLQFRRHGIAVILLHHAGKTGQIRGTTKREDAAAWVISLTDAKERSIDKRGSRFVSYFSKQSRNCMDTLAYEWHVVLEDGEVTTSYKLAQGGDLVLQCIKDGVTECTMIASEMGISAATVCRLAKKLQDQGKIEVRGRKYILTLSEELE